MRDGEIAAQKAALSKALSAAYLEHQVADLESRVNAIGVNGGVGDDVRVGGDGGARVPPEGARGTHGAIGDGAPRRSPMTSAPVSPRAPGGPLFKPANAPGLPAAAVGAPNRAPLAGSPPAAHPPAAGDGVERASRSQRSAGTRDEVERVARIDDSDDDDGDDHDAWRVAVVDVSALMWAPHSVRSLLQRGGEVIVPLDAVRTLDMLKKGGSPAAVAARAAARFVEHASRHWRPISADPSIAVQGGTNYRRGQGLRLQRETEERALNDAENDTPPPKWVASVLGCAAFFSVIARAEDEWDEHPAVLIAHPPLSAEIGPNPVDERRGPGAPPHAPGAGPEAQTSYADRAEGYTLSLEAGRFELRLEVLRDEDADKDVPRQRRRNHHNNEHGHEQRGRGGRGRGRGRGGRAGGTNTNAGAADAEPVRILLRRPDHDDAPAGAVGAAAPAPPHMPPPPHQAASMPIKQAAPPAPPAPTATPSAAPVLLTPDAHRGRGGGGAGASGGGRGRGRGRGRGSERNPDRGGGFTLLQRPGPPLAHHVRDVGEVGAGAGGAGTSGGAPSGSAPSGSGAGGGGGNKPRRDRGRDNSRDRRGASAGGSGGQWRRAYAANDESPRVPRQQQQPKAATPALERERDRERDQPRVVLLQRPR